MTLRQMKKPPQMRYVFGGGFFLCNLLFFRFSLQMLPVFCRDKQMMRDGSTRQPAPGSHTTDADVGETKCIPQKFLMER